MRLRLGSRGSALARWQAETVQARLRALGHECEIEFIETAGDRRADVRLSSIGGKGLFTWEIEAGLRSGRVDLAVHSLKDVPSHIGADFQLGAILEREDARDALVAAPGVTLAGLPPGARVGTGSLRRQAQLLAMRPDLEVVPVRGNVDTRLRKWRAGEFDALILAAAGLKRLGLSAEITEWIAPEAMLPAAGQGALALECRAGDEATLAAILPLRHASSADCVAAERALLRRLDCGCQSPVAAYAAFDAQGLRLRALAAGADGRAVIRADARADARGPEAPQALGLAVAEMLLDRGAGPLLEAVL